MASGCDSDAGREAVARAICSISCISEGKREFARSEVCSALLQMGARAETDSAREAVCRAIRNIAIVPEMKAEFATHEASSIFVNLALCSSRCSLLAFLMPKLQRSSSHTLFSEGAREAVARVICSVACIASGKLAFSTSAAAAALCSLAIGASADDTIEWASRAVCNIALVSQGKAQLQTPELQAALVHMARNACSDGAREWVCRAIIDVFSADTAAQVFREFSDDKQRSLGPNHAESVASVVFLGTFYLQHKMYEEAEAVFVDCLQRSISALGPDHSCTILSMTFLLKVYQATRQHDKAEACISHCISKCSKKQHATVQAIQDAGACFRTSVKALQQEQAAERVMLHLGVPCFFKRIIGEPQCDLLSYDCDYLTATATFSSHQVSTVGAPMCAVSSLLNPPTTSGTDGRAYGRAYYEITIVELKGCIQAGWASTGMRGSDLKSNDGVGDCPFSWAADGDRQLKWHLAHTGLWGGRWAEGDVIGIACDLNARELSWFVCSVIGNSLFTGSRRSVNGSFESPNGVAFAGDEAPDTSTVVYVARAVFFRFSLHCSASRLTRSTMADTLPFRDKA
jgi:hypothetical protein